MGVWDSERRGLTVGIVATVTLIAFEGLAVATIMPDVRDDLGGITLYGWAFSAFFLTSLVGTVVAGRAADRRGVGPPFSAGVVLFTAGLAVAATAPSMLVLVIGRAVQGLGAGAVSASAVTAVARGYPEELRPRMFATMSTAWVVPGLVGPALSSVIAETIGWRWVFAGLLPLIAGAAAIAIPRLRGLQPEADAATNAPPSQLRRAVLLTVGAGVLLAGLGERNVLIAIPLAVVGLAVGIPALRSLVPRMPAGVALKGLLTFAFFGTDAYISLSVTSVRHSSVTVAGIALTAATLTWTVGAWLNAQWAERVVPRVLIAAGLSLIAVAIVIMTLALYDTAPLGTFVVAWAVGGLGMGIAYQAVTLAVLAGAPVGQEGAASAAQQLTDLLGVAVGTGVVGAIVAVGNGAGWAPSSALRIGFAVTVAVALVAIGMTRRLPATSRSGLAPGVASRSGPSLG